jgi:hypothetical protein
LAGARVDQQSVLTPAVPPVPVGRAVKPGFGVFSTVVLSAAKSVVSWPISAVNAVACC